MLRKLFYALVIGWIVIFGTNYLLIPIASNIATIFQYFFGIVLVCVITFLIIGGMNYLWTTDGIGGGIIAFPILIIMCMIDMGLVSGMINHHEQEKCLSRHLGPEYGSYEYKFVFGRSDQLGHCELKLKTNGR